MQRTVSCLYVIVSIMIRSVLNSSLTSTVCICIDVYFKMVAPCPYGACLHFLVICYADGVTQILHMHATKCSSVVVVPAGICILTGTNFNI